MTKEIFVSTLDNELEKLAAEYQEAQKRDSYFNLIDNVSNHEEIRGQHETVKYQLQVLEKRLQEMRAFLNLPLYARIQEMSDLEIEAYKSDKIAEIELKRREIEVQEEQRKSELIQLTAEQQELISKISSLTEAEKESAILRAQELQSEISRRLSKDSWGDTSTDFKREIQKTEEEKEQIRAKSSQEIKDGMVAELGIDVKALSQSMENNAKDAADTCKQMLSAVANNPEKARQMAELLSQYGNLYVLSKSIEFRALVEGVNNIPSFLLNIIRSDYKYESNKSVSFRLSHSIDYCEREFNENKEKITPDVVRRLYEKFKGYRNFSTEVDIPFLKANEGMIFATCGALNRLSSKLEEKDNLRQKLFKTKANRTTESKLDEQINDFRIETIAKIISGYLSRARYYLGCEITASYYLGHETTEVVKEEDLLALEKVLTEKIQSFGESFGKLRDNIKKYEQSFDGKKAECLQQIRTLAGPQFAEAKVTNISLNPAENLTHIANAAAVVQTSETVQRIQDESQIQAYAKEAELRGITPEQLYIEKLKQMKNQVQMASMQSSTPNQLGTNGAEEFTGKGM